jgi:hypothetical protein
MSGPGPVDGGGGGLERAPKPPDLWDAMRAQVDRAFADFFGGDYRWPKDGDDDAGSPCSGCGPE